MDDNEKCRTCKHRTRYGSKLGCQYVLNTGLPRGCEFGQNCTKHEKGEAIKRREHIFIEKVPLEVREDEQAYRDYREFKHRRLGK